MANDTQSQKDAISAYQDALISMFVQAGVVIDYGEIDTNQICVSAYEEAFNLLKRDGRVVERKIPRRFMSARKALFFTNAGFCGALDGSDYPPEPDQFRHG